MTKNDDKRVPVLRFKGFNDDWAQRKLGDNITVSKIKNKKNNHFIPYSISNKWGFIPQEKQFGEGNAYSKTNKATNYIVEPNAFAYNPARINVGSIAYQNNQFPVIVSSLYEIFKTKKNLNDKFLMNWFKTEKFTRQIQKLQEGGVRQYFFIDKMQESRITIPSISQEEEISKALDQINNLINLQQRKAKQLKLLKKAMLQMLYTKEYIPSLRFMEFSTKWNLVKLGDVTYRYDNLRQPVIASQRTHGKIPYYGANGIQDHVDGYTHKGKFLLIAEDGANDIHNYPVKYVDGKIWVNNHAHVIQSMPDKVDDIFLLNAIKIINMQPYLVGGSRAKLNADVMNKIPIKLPTLQEQKDIGSLAYHLDKLIKLCLSKNSQLQSVKQFLLQNMFI